MSRRIDFSLFPFPSMRATRPWVPPTVFALSLLINALICFVIYRTIADRDEVRFQNEINRVVTSLDTRMAAYRALLRATAGLFGLSTPVTRDEFGNFYERQRVEQEYPGVLGVGYAPRIAPGSIDSFETEMRRLGLPDYRVTPETSLRDRYPIAFLEPRSPRNRAIMGFDMYSDPIRREAMDLACNTGLSAMTGKVRLKHETEEHLQAGFLFYNPTYEGNTIPKTVAERRRLIKGFVYSPFRTDDLFEQIAKDVGTRYVDYLIYDGNDTAAAMLLHNSAWKQSRDDGFTPHLQSIKRITVVGRPWTLVFRNNAAFESVSEREILPIIATLGFLFSLGLLYVTRSQVAAYRQLELSARKLRSAQDELAQFNMELERRVQERTAELTASNDELEAFAYSVSHDLRAPLRGIDGFSKFLMDDYGDRIDDTGKEYIRRIRHATHRMGDLIDDLLKLSRVTRWELQRQEVDFTGMAREIVKQLREREPDRTVEVTIDERISGYGDPRLLRIALENLLENAWKFTGKSEQAAIRFSQEFDNDGSVYVIRDNGAGFESSYADSLFESFRRLHAPSDFPGTGIGLATVKRVIQRHGGRIWGEGAVEKGAVFRFTLG